MTRFNAITSAVFDVLLAPWGHRLGILDLILWSVLSGIAALLVYRRVSNQQGITRAKERIKMHLLEIRLWRHDLRIVLGATARILGSNAAYLGHNVLPMLALAPPFLLVLVQLEAHFAFAPAEVNAPHLLRVALDPSHHAATDGSVSAIDVTLETPAGVLVDAPAVRTASGEIFWRLRPTAAGDHVLTLRAGSHRLTKGFAVGGALRKVPVKRTKSLEALLYPGEAPIDEASPFASAELQYPGRHYPGVPSGELGVLILFFLLSVASGFVLKDLFGVTL